MALFRRLFSIGLGLAAGAAALKLLKNQQEKGVFELSEKDYVEIPLDSEDTDSEQKLNENESVSEN